MVNDLPPGTGSGAEVYLDRLVTALRGGGDEVEIFVPTRPHRGATRLLDFWDPFARHALSRHAKRFRPDVVHYHNVARELSASVFGVCPGLPRLLTAHDFWLFGDAGHETQPVRRFVQKHIKRRFDASVARRHVDAVVAVSETLAASLRDAGFANTRYIPVPITAPAVEPAPVSSCRDLLFVGRLGLDKGVRVLTAAFESLRGDHPDTRLIFVGAGPERDRLAHSPGIEVRGRLEPAALSRLYGQVRAVVFPSLWRMRREGAGLVIPEAAVHGRPVVVSDDPAATETADRLGNAVVTPAGDPQALADVLRRLLSDDTLATDLGERGRERALRDHGADVVAARVRALYAELTSVAR